MNINYGIDKLIYQPEDRSSNLMLLSKRQGLQQPSYQGVPFRRVNLLLL